MPTVISVGPGTGGFGTTALEAFLTTSTTMSATEVPLSTISNANSRQEVQVVSLLLGDNVVLIPTWAGAVIVVFPVANTTVTVALNLGGTLLPLNMQGWFMLSFATPPPASLTLTTSAALADVQIYWV